MKASVYRELLCYNENSIIILYKPLGKLYKEVAMCLAVPAQLVSINDTIGTIELTGAQRDCSLLLVPEAKVGDWLLVHAGFAVQIVDEEEAKATMDAFRELEELEDAYFAGKTQNS